MTDKYNFLDYAELNSEQKGLIKNLARALDAYPIKCIYEDWDTILLTAWENNTPRGYIEYTTSNNGPGIVLDTIGCLPNNYFLRTYDKTMAEEIFDLMLFHNLKREYVRVEEVTNTGIKFLKRQMKRGVLANTSLNIDKAGYLFQSIQIKNRIAPIF